MTLSDIEAFALGLVAGVCATLIVWNLDNERPDIPTEPDDPALTQRGQQ